MVLEQLPLFAAMLNPLEWLWSLPLELCGPASRLPFLLRASVRRHRSNWEE
jgi:hypothetical protein